MLLEQKEIAVFVRAFDHELLNLQLWADGIHYDIENDPEFCRLCDKLTDLEEHDVIPVTAVTIFFNEIDALKKKCVKHTWTLQSNYTGETFTLIGEVGDTTAYEAMRKQGLDSAIWAVIAELN